MPDTDGPDGPLDLSEGEQQLTEDVGGFIGDNQPAAILQLLGFDGKPVGVPITVRSGDEVQMVNGQLEVTPADQVEARDRILEQAVEAQTARIEALTADLEVLKEQLEDMLRRLER